LIGWAVDASHLPSQYVGGDLGVIDRSTLWYEFTFQSVRIGGSLVEWGAKVTVEIASSGAAAVLTALASKLATTLGGTRMTREVATGRQVIAQNSTVFRMLWADAPWVIDSNTTGDRLAIELTVIRHLGAAEAERDYTEGDYLTEQKAIGAPSYWQVASDVEVQPDTKPELTTPIDPAA
jgi:hypothetical protein